jgi:tRNA threonylcarbamoyladenosine biosynthesis protein TsaE
MRGTFFLASSWQWSNKIFHEIEKQRLCSLLEALRCGEGCLVVTEHLPRETLELVSRSAQQTQHIGRTLGTLLRGGELLLFEGQLGAGKTTFTQGLAKGLGITTTISSPTFTILKEYPGQPRAQSERIDGSWSTASSQRGPALYHFDLYRLEDPDEILDLGFEDYFSGSGVCVIEWAENADISWLPERLAIHLSVINETERRLRFIATGTVYCELLRHLQKQIYASTGF